MLRAGYIARCRAYLGAGLMTFGMLCWVHCAVLGGRQSRVLGDEDVLRVS